MDKFDARQAALDLVTAFVNNNSVKAQELPALLSEVYSAIAGFDGKAVDPVAETSSEVLQDEPAPATDSPAVVDAASSDPKAAVSIEESLSDPNYIVSMITGEKLKTLARHLRRHGLDEQQYRERYQLAEDYPMVAPAYSEFRRNIAKKMSLGRIGRAKPVQEVVPSPIVGSAASTEPAAVKAKKVTKTSSKKTGSEKQATKRKPEHVAAKAGTPPSSASAPKAEPEQQGKDTIKKVETYNPASTPANVRAPSAAEPSVDIVDTVATVAAVKPAKRVRKVNSPTASPDSSAVPAPVKSRARPAASEILQKADDVASAAVKTRRSKLSPVFSD
jgi:predicted transcriptional regulator